MDCIDEKSVENNTRDWGSLNRDILVHVFDRLGVNSMLGNVGFVCRSWAIACLDVVFWNEPFLDLNFSGFFRLLGSPAEYPVLERRAMGLIRTILDGDRYFHHKTEAWSGVHLPDFHVSDRILLYIAQRTPRVETLFFSSFEKREGFSRTLSHWKSTIFLILNGSCFNKYRGDMFKNHRTERQIGDNSFVVDEEIAMAIAQNLKKLKDLRLVYCCVNKEAMRIILNECRGMSSVTLEGCMLKVEEEEEGGEGGCSSTRLKEAVRSDFRGCLGRSNIRLRVFHNRV